MVIFQTDRQVRCKAILDADTNSGAPTRCSCRSDIGAAGVENVEPVVCDGCASLEVEQRGRVPAGPTKLAGEQAYAVRFDAGREERIYQTGFFFFSVCAPPPFFPRR